MMIFLKSIESETAEQPTSPTLRKDRCLQKAKDVRHKQWPTESGCNWSPVKGIQ